MHTFFGCTGITKTTDVDSSTVETYQLPVLPMNTTSTKTALDFGPTGRAAKANRMRVKVSPRIIWMSLSTGNVMD
jgi:hypothetical protein